MKNYIATTMVVTVWAQECFTNVKEVGLTLWDPRIRSDLFAAY